MLLKLCSTTVLHQSNEDSIVDVSPTLSVCSVQCLISKTNQIFLLQAALRPRRNPLLSRKVHQHEELFSENHCKILKCKNRKTSTFLFHSGSDKTNFNALFGCLHCTVESKKYLFTIKPFQKLAIVSQFKICINSLSSTGV